MLAWLMLYSLASLEFQLIFKEKKDEEATQ